MGFDIDTKIHCYILREGETKAPDFIQKVFDKAIAGQWIMAEGMKIGMTAGESMEAMVKLMEDAGYLYTPFIDSHEHLLDGTRDGDEDYIDMNDSMDIEYRTEFVSQIIRTTIELDKNTCNEKNID